MECAYPTPARHDPHMGDVTLWPPIGEANVALPCGTCLACKSNRALDWATRAQHEASLYPYNVFLTLTYRDEDLPKDEILRPEDLSAFIKRLRAHHTRGNPALRSTPGARLRYLACGEYGTRTGRPHYHLCLFNVGFADVHTVANGLTESKLLTKLWPHGSHRLGELSGASANYVAQYTMKKLGADDYVDADGVIRPAPFIRVSLKPLLGAKWLEKYERDVQHGYLVTADGQQRRIPRAYKQLLAKLNPQLAEQSAFRAEKAQKDKQRRASRADADPAATAAGAKATAGLTTKSQKRLQQRREAQSRTDALAAQREAGERIQQSRIQHSHLRKGALHA